MDEVGLLLLKEIEDDADELWLLMQRKKLQLRHRAYVTITSLLRPSGSPWSQLYEHGDDSHIDIDSYIGASITFLVVGMMVI